ncbi:MAG TPA: protein tyrosine phosphatase [Bacteroidia bacterium]|jgi:protein-tyrosine phosphatase|nr:protein tyrosine phosphatase [Bacteroidia bacterium]
MNILFICSRNQWRSPTAEAIYKNSEGLRVKSAGTEPSARIKLTAGLIEWADLIFVMEKKHKERLTSKFPDQTSAKTIIILDIPDEYGYMDEELIASIKVSVSHYLAQYNA